ncbi:unnamed protein product [Peniophora sp. CBMAI 1063]|nr:unnamed protein product [Peniophora sp. CBMAI 1063]
MADRAEVPLQDATMQDQVADLSKLPPTRKQNIACDACRQRKVKCHQVPGQTKHCLAKNYPCTHHAQQATTERKRMTSSSKRPRATTSNGRQASGSGGEGSSKDGQNIELKFPTTQPSQSNATYAAQVTEGSPQPQSALRYEPPRTFSPPLRRDSPFGEILAYLFAPPEDGKVDRSTISANSPQYPWRFWGELAHNLEEESYRFEFALDLVEVFFQIVHARLPFLNPTQFRERLQSQMPTASTTPNTAFTGAQSTAPPGQSQFGASSYASTSTAPFPPSSAYHGASGQYAGATPAAAFHAATYSKATTHPLESHPALIAVVIAWGAKFSEHPLLVADRNASGPSKQSGLARTLINRAREISEGFKVHRIPKVEHVVITLMTESLQSQKLEGDGWRGFWLASAIRHLFSLKINHKSVLLSIPDREERGMLVFAWWFACLCDSYASTYHRRMPIIKDDDYDVDFYTAEPLSDDATRANQGPREHLEILGYYSAAHALARVARKMSQHLWTPAAEAQGISIDVLADIIGQLQNWRTSYLSQVGVPTNFAPEWDFVSAVSACASDSTFHVMWVILFNAVDDFGVRELIMHHRMGSPQDQASYQMQLRAEEVMRTILDEGLHGALRIAGLAGVLTKNGYLRLDPAIMHISCINAGSLLARFGRIEVENCVAGLDQYAYSYCEAGEQARDLERTYACASRGDDQFKHMAGCIAHYHQQPQRPSADPLSPPGTILHGVSPNGSQSVTSSPLQPIHTQMHQHPHAVGVPQSPHDLHPHNHRQMHPQEMHSPTTPVTPHPLALNTHAMHVAAHELQSPIDNPGMYGTPY